MTIDGSCIDLDVLTKFVQKRTADHSFKVLEIFVSELRKKEATLEVAISTKDFEAVKMIAHATVGSGLLLGATRLVNFGRSIEERWSRDEPLDWTEAETLLMILKSTVIEFEMRRTKDALDVLRSQNCSAP